MFIYKPVIFNLNMFNFCTGLDIFAVNSATQCQRCHNEDRGLSRLMNERLVHRQMKRASRWMEPSQFHNQDRLQSLRLININFQSFAITSLL